MSVFSKFISILPPGLMKKFWLLVPFVGVVGILEVVSVASIIPLMTVALEPETLGKSMSYIGLEGIEHTHALLYLMIVTITLFIGKSIFSMFVYKRVYSITTFSRFSLQKLLLKSYLNKTFSYHNKNNSSDYVRNVVSECATAEARFFIPILILMAEAVPVLFLTALLLYVNPIGLLLAVSIFFVAGLVMMRFSSSKLRGYGYLQLVNDGKSLKTLQKAFYCIKEIYLYKCKEQVISEFSESAQKSTSAIGSALYVTVIPRFVMEAVAIICIFAIAVLSYLLGDTVQEIIVSIGVFAGAVMKLLPSISKIVTQTQSLHHARPTLENLIGVLETASSNVELAKSQGNSFEFRSLAFDNVSLEYSESGLVLDNCSFSIQRGDVVGVVGETGSGKSTLINIILGLIEPSSGQVSVNGESLEDIRGEFTSVIGYVPQETYLVDESLYNNIVFFRANDDMESRDWVRSLLEDVSLFTLVNKLESGIDSSVGEQGCRLSGGQRQRVGIARALYNKPNILILDEATSALDKKTEQQIMELILRFKGETTIIMIAHRESTLQSCDYILKVSNGKVNKSLALD